MAVDWETRAEEAEARVRELEASRAGCMREFGDERVERASAEQRLAHANALIIWVLRESTVQGLIRDQLEAHLAAQPAAPEPKPLPMVLHCPECFKSTEPAAPSRTEAAPMGEHPSEPDEQALRQQVEFWREQATTEAEKAVLDAMETCTVQQLEDCIRLGHRIGGAEKPWGMVVAEAELARRGLK